MKKALILSTIAFALSAAPAYAATIQLAPQTVSVAPGDTVTVTISIDPSTATISAIKSALSYPTNLLAPTSFTLAPSWIALTQSGYDQMGGGTVIKSGGYPGGVKSPTLFGTLVFTATAAGTATIAVQNSSVAYDGTSNNELSGTQGSATITIGTAAPAPTGSTGTTTFTSTPTTQTTSSTGGGTGSTGGTRSNLSGTTGTAPSANAAASEPTTSPSTTGGLQGGTGQTAAVANAFAGFGPWWAWLLGILALMLLGSGGWYWYSRRANKTV